MGISLVKMYGKCGCIENAQQVFDRIPEPNVVSWNVTISGYVEDANVYEVMKLFFKCFNGTNTCWICTQGVSK